MAFVAGWQTEDIDGLQFGKDMAFDNPDDSGAMRDLFRISDKGWEAAKGSFKMVEKNQWDSPTFKHFFAFEMVQCDSVCWRMGVAHEEFPVNDLWSWFKTLEVGEAPPWAVVMAGGKTEIQVFPPSLLKAGECKLNKDYRDTKKVKPIERNTVLDGAGRVRLRKGDVIGVSCDMGKKHGDCVVCFYINGVLMHEPLHLYCSPHEKWLPFVCLGNTQVRVKMMHPLEVKWDVMEEQEIRKADIAFKKGEPVFEGAGWLSRQQGITQTWVRSWYQLGFAELLYVPNPKAFIKIHGAADLEPMDANGLADPYVRVFVGEDKFDPTEKTGLLAYFRGSKGGYATAQTTIKYKTLKPSWEEYFELPINNIKGWVSFCVFDNDIMSQDDLIGSHYLEIEEVERASYKASTLKKYQSKWLPLKQTESSGVPAGRLLVSIHVGQEKPKESKKTSLLGRIAGGGRSEIGRLELERMRNVRAGVHDTEILVDYTKEHKDTKIVTFRVDASHERKGWLYELHKAVMRRIMSAKARTRVERLLENEHPPRSALDDPVTELDPSEFHDLGFSRVKRTWHEHPLKAFVGQNAQKLAFELQCTDQDVVELCKPLKTNKWCRLLRLDCFAFSGFIGDVGAEALADVLMVNDVLKSLNLRGNRIGDKGATMLSKALKKNRTLESLNLDGNQITKQGAIQLLAAIMGDATKPPNLAMKVSHALSLHSLPPSPSPPLSVRPPLALAGLLPLSSTLYVGEAIVLILQPHPPFASFSPCFCGRRRPSPPSPPPVDACTCHAADKTGRGRGGVARVCVCMCMSVYCCWRALSLTTSRILMSP